MTTTPGSSASRISPRTPSSNLADTPPLAGLTTLLADDPTVVAASAGQGHTVAVPEARARHFHRDARERNGAAAGAGRGADPGRGRTRCRRSAPVPRRRRGRAVPGVGDAPVRAGVAQRGDDGSAPAGDVAPADGWRTSPGGDRGADPRVGAAARSARRGRRADRGAPRRAARPRRPRRAARCDGVPARVPGGSARRARGARLDRRRVPVHRRSPGAHRPMG